MHKPVAHMSCHVHTAVLFPRCWELLYATCELISSINPALEGQLQQHMRLERAASNNMLTRDGFTFYVMERCVHVVRS